MRKLLFIALLFAFGSVFAAAPAVTCTPSVTSGTAPMAVFLDCTGTTGVTLHTGLFTHNFGDASAGNWTTGANTALSKNQAIGAMAAHVYETAGSYTIKSVVCNSSNECATASNAITVAAADTTWATTATECIANSTATAGAGGCPAGAATPAGTSDFDAALAACIATNKRCLFKRGDTFTRSATVTIGALTQWYVGAYGTGERPIVTGTNVTAFTFNNDAVANGRIADLDIRGNGATDTGLCANIGASPTNMVFLRIKCSEIGKGFVIGDATDVLTGSIFQENEVTNFYAASGGNAFFGRVATSAFLGNTLGPQGSGGEHVLRIQRWNKAVVSNNTLAGVADTDKTVLTMRADVFSSSADNSIYGIISDNKLTGGSGAYTHQIGPSASSEDARISNAVVERNWYIAGASTTTAVFVTASSVTVRNNIANTTGGTSHICWMVANDNNNASVTTDANAIYNNTCYSGDTAGNFTMVYLDGVTNGVTNTVVKNNLGYAPNDTAHRGLLEGGTTSGTTASNNSLTTTAGGNGVLIDPQFTGALTSPSGFRVAAASYAADGGTAQYPAQTSDFFNCFDKSSENRIGAIVQAGQQQCRGVAGP